MATTIDDATRRAGLERHLGLVGDSDVATAHAIYHDDAVLEFPRSGERFEGVENFHAWRARYPADVAFRVRRISVSGDVWVGRCRSATTAVRGCSASACTISRRSHRPRVDLRHRAVGRARLAGALACRHDRRLIAAWARLSA